MREYEWAFARFLHTPPNALGQLTVQQFLNGRRAIELIRGGTE